MNRRQALMHTTALLGTIVFASDLLKAEEYLAKKSLGKTLDKNMVVILDQIADTMLPTTSDSPGAKAAGCGKVMAGIIKNCYTPEDQKLMTALLDEINLKSQETFKNDFEKLTYTKRLDVLTPFDLEKDINYVKLKELVVFVYFTSEIGMHKALRYLEVPGRYDGSMPYKNGKAWAWSFFTY